MQKTIIIKLFLNKTLSQLLFKKIQQQYQYNSEITFFPFFLFLIAIL